MIFDILSAISGIKAEQKIEACQYLCGSPSSVASKQIWGTTFHLSAKIYHFCVGAEAYKRITAGLDETEDDGSEAVTETSGFKRSPSQRITPV